MTCIAMGQIQVTLHIVCNNFEKKVSVARGRKEKVAFKGSGVKELVVDLRDGK